MLQFLECGRHIRKRRGAAFDVWVTQQRRLPIYAVIYINIERYVMNDLVIYSRIR